MGTINWSALLPVWVGNSTARGMQKRTLTSVVRLLRSRLALTQSRAMSLMLLFCSSRICETWASEIVKSEGFHN